ncbi:septum site-determining protein MinC [Dethiothermospora halolimnae]|uniref:septum site-determining protein MinC n=1 Tax=Dethiothermospora halolimnae TaxID=3114390 RepID=UPI003CCBEBFC
MGTNLITFKGNEKGIYVYIKNGDFKKIKLELDDMLNKSKDFFKGGKVVNFKGRSLSLEEKSELKYIINNKYGIAVEEIIEKDDNKDNVEANYFFEGIEEGKTKFVRTTIRSGQKVEYDGNIIILGDINPGGEVTAKGNIIVLGVLRGIAHAGCDGNTEAIVAAFRLQPTQLRIADFIARSPDDDDIISKWPELAKIKDDMVLIEPYLPKK